MSNAAAHSGGGLAVGIAASFLDQNPPEERFTLGSILTGSALFGAKLPDILEPAHHPNHRQFYHSIVVLVAALGGATLLWRWRPETADGRRIRAALFGLSAGYCSHLGMDMTTPKGLPLI